MLHALPLEASRQKKSLNRLPPLVPSTSNPPSLFSASPAITSLAGPNPEARGSAIDALKNFGPQARSAVPALTKALNHTNARVPEKAINGLTTIGPECAAKMPGTPPPPE